MSQAGPDHIPAAAARGAQKPALYLSRTKITPPSASRFDVLRQAVLDRVAANEESQLVLVRAPAGFGKTTAMKQLAAWYRERDIAVAWLTLDESDNDVSRFLIGLSAAIDEAEPPRTPRQPEPVRNDDRVLSIMGRIVAGRRPMAFFFDDFEVLRNPVVIGLIARSVDALPPDARIVIGTRAVPDIGLARLRARGVLIEVDAELLRFTAQETESFLVQRKGLTLDHEQIARLNRSAEGWIAALWLASLALERRSDAAAFLASFSGSNAAIAEYLAQDVLAKLPTALRDFLLRCSVLSELTPALCDAVCGVDNSRELLRALQDRNLFLIPLDEGGDHFRFHSLFRDFLRNQLKRERADELGALHLRAARAYLAVDRPVPATTHALQSGDITLAMPLLDRQADELLAQGRLRLLAGWIEMLPKDELAQQPRLRLIHAWCVGLTRGAREALAMIADLDADTLAPESAAHLRALRPLLLAMMDRITEAHAMALQALPLMPAAFSFASAMLYQALTRTSIILGKHAEARGFVDDSRRLLGPGLGTFGLTLAESAEASLDLMGGHLQQARARLNLASNTFGVDGEAPRSGNALNAIQLAEVLYEADDCDGARRLLEFYSPLVQDLGLPDALISTHVLLARIVHEQGQRDRAVQLLTELEAIGHRLGLPRAVASARLERSQQRLVEGDFAGALEQLTAAENSFSWQDVADYWFIANDTLTPTICRLRWMVRSGAAGKAVPLLRAELAEAESAQRARRALKLRILLAEALQADRQQKMAQRTLVRALQFARGEGFIRSFLEEGAALQALLRELQGLQHETAREAEAQLPGGTELWLRKTTETAPAPAASSELAEPLTRKELQTLQLLARGYSNNEMAERLFISESTVRTHLRNINFKLQVGSRTQAIAVARKLGLLG